MSPIHLPSSNSRRQFLRQLIGAGALTLSGIDPLFSQPAPGPAPATGAGAFRFAFVTDLHLLENGDLNSVRGIAAALQAVGNLDPKPEFIIAGGDLVDKSRDLAIPAAVKSMHLFMKTWQANTSLPVHWIFGNHDLVATSYRGASSSDPNYGKGLFKSRLNLSKTFYSFDYKGWHFVVLDDIALDTASKYYGALADEELAFLQADLEAHKNQPVIVATHIPILSNLPTGMMLTGKLRAPFGPNGIPTTLVCTNGGTVLGDTATHNIRAILCGHLHYQEAIDFNGVKIVNFGAVSGNYWKGPSRGCPEGFGIVDVGADGSVSIDYHAYGWKAVPA